MECFFVLAGKNKGAGSKEQGARSKEQGARSSVGSPADLIYKLRKNKSQL